MGEPIHLDREDIPADWPVQPLGPDEHPKGRTTCGACGLSWDDDKPTSLTPTPSARCPFEHFHEYEEDETGHTHEPVWNTLQPADCDDGIVDVWCKCGKSGSVRIDPEDIQWD